jgi:hypothetical protein
MNYFQGRSGESWVSDSSNRFEKVQRRKSRWFASSTLTLQNKRECPIPSPFPEFEHIPTGNSAVAIRRAIDPRDADFGSEQKQLLESLTTQTEEKKRRADTRIAKIVSYSRKVVGEIRKQAIGLQFV